MGRSLRRSSVAIACAVLASVGVAATYLHATSEASPKPSSSAEPARAAEPEGPAEAEREAQAREPDPPQTYGADAATAEGPPRRERRYLHSADPCRPVAEPSIPDGDERLTAQNITLAWPEGGPSLREPTAFAYLVAGLLEEAASVTGTVRVDRLTVIFYSTLEEFRALSGAPKWAGGLYDGAVKIPMMKGEPFGASLTTLRDELMHAQLHAGVGCTPLWFNEGLAMHFAGRPLRQEWMRMLRDGQALAPASLETSTVEEGTRDDIDLVYAQSLAMVLFMVERRPADAGIREAISELAGVGSSPSNRLRLWSRHYSEVGGRELLDFLARRIFKLRRGPELDAVFQTAVCCHGDDLSDFGCYGAPLVPGKSIWFDRNRTPSAICRAGERQVGRRDGAQ